MSEARLNHTAPARAVTARRLELVVPRRKTVRYLSAITPQMRSRIISELRGGREVVIVAQTYQVREVVVLELLAREALRVSQGAA